MKYRNFDQISVDESYSVKELAGILCLTDGAIRDWIKRGGLTQRRHPISNLFVIDGADLIVFLAKKYKNSSATARLHEKIRDMGFTSSEVSLLAGFSRQYSEHLDRTAKTYGKHTKEVIDSINKAIRSMEEKIKELEIIKAEISSPPSVEDIEKKYLEKVG